MKLIFIYGPPAEGKLTIATDLGRLTQFAVFDNHRSIDCVLPVFGFETPSLFKVVHKIRLDVLEEAAREDVDVIFTFVYAHPQDAALVEEYCTAVETCFGTVCFVQLTCDIGTQEARVQDPGRASREKTRSLERVREWNARLDLRTPIPLRESLRIDNSALLPADVAQLIASHYKLPLHGLGSTSKSVSRTHE